MQITEIKTDDTLRELRPHGRPDFPFEYYYDDIKGFDKQYVEMCIRDSSCSIPHYFTFTVSAI